MSRKLNAAHAAIAAELIDLRLSAGLSRCALAEQIGIQAVDVDHSECGCRPPDVVELFHWCQACGSCLDAFMERVDQRLALVAHATRH